MTRRQACREIWDEAKKIPTEVSATYSLKIKERGSFFKALKSALVLAIGMPLLSLVIFIVAMIDPNLGDE